MQVCNIHERENEEKKDAGHSDNKALRLILSHTANLAQVQHIQLKNVLQREEGEHLFLHGHCLQHSIERRRG